MGLIDGDWLLYVATNPEKELDQEGNPVRKDNKFVYQSNQDVRISIAKMNNVIIDILDSIEAEYYLGFLTGGSFRYKINQDYKANRKGRERPKYFKVLKEYLIDHWGFYQHSELEADDLVRIASKKWNDWNGIFEINGIGTKVEGSIIVSNDKDILNLEGLHYNPQKQQFIETTKDQAIEYFWKSMIVGDSADNIKGIPKMGEKGAEKLFNGLSCINLPSVVFNKYVSIMGDNEGIEEFYKNYKSLLILDEYKGLELPQPIKCQKKEEVK